MRLGCSAADVDCVCPCCRPRGPFGQALESSVDKKCEGLLVGFKRYEGVDTLKCAVVRGDFVVEVQSALGLLLLKDRNGRVVAGSLNGEGEEGTTVMMAGERGASCMPDERK